MTHYIVFKVIFVLVLNATWHCIVFKVIFCVSPDSYMALYCVQGYFWNTILMETIFFAFPQSQVSYFTTFVNLLNCYTFLVNNSFML